MAINKSICKSNSLQKETSTVCHKTICGFTPYLVARFLSKVKVDKHGCWIWNGCKNDRGYGEFFIGRRFIFYAHRVSYSWFIGNIPPGKLVCHLCDVKSCCNPSHLFLGTQTDNMQDAVRKGIMHRGETSGQSKLTEKEVIEIRNKYKKGVYGFKRLAREYKTDWSNIRFVVQRKTWKHI